MERQSSGDLSVDGRVVLKSILKEQGLRVWTGFILLRKEINGRLF
jgi:hypothetical protein